MSVIINQDTEKNKDETGNLLKKATTINQYRFFNGFQIATIKEGHNFGRSYHMQAESNDECNKIASIISKWSLKAEKAARNASRFQKSQKKLLIFYNSVIFQAVSSVLILAVRATIGTASSYFTLSF